MGLPDVEVALGLLEESRAPMAPMAPMEPKDFKDFKAPQTAHKGIKEKTEPPA
jgi:hypothetical protein